MRDGPLSRYRWSKALVSDGGGDKNINIDQKAAETHRSSSAFTSTKYLDLELVHSGSKKKKKKREGGNKFSIRDVYALSTPPEDEEEEPREPNEASTVIEDPDLAFSSMRRRPRTNVDDLATGDNEKFLVLRDVDGIQVGRNGLITDAPSPTNSSVGRDSPTLLGRTMNSVYTEARVRSNGSAKSNGSGINMNAPKLIIEKTVDDLFEEREPPPESNRVSVRESTRSPNGSKRSVVCRTRTEESERIEWNSFNNRSNNNISPRPSSPRSSKYLEPAGSGSHFSEPTFRDFAKSPTLEEQIEVVASTKSPRSTMPPVEEEQGVPPPPPTPSCPTPKKKGLSSFFIGRKKRMDLARERRRKLDEMKKEKKEDKKTKNKKISNVSSKLTKSPEETCRQMASSKQDVLALAKELRSRGIAADSQEELKSTSGKPASRKNMMMKKITPDAEQLFFADFDPKHFEENEQSPMHSPPSPTTGREGPPSPFRPSSPFRSLRREEKPNKRSLLKRLSAGTSKRKNKEEKQQQAPNEGQLFFADFDPKNFESASANISKKEDGDVQDSNEPQQKKPLPDPSAAAGMLLSKLQNQRRVAEQRLKVNGTTKHQTIGTELDPHQVELKARTVKEIANLTVQSNLTRSALSRNFMEASTRKEYVDATGKREAGEDGLAQHDAYIASLASVSDVSASDVETASEANIVQLSKKEIDHILEDVSARNVVHSIKEELNGNPNTSPANSNNTNANSKPKTNTGKAKRTPRQYEETLAEHEQQLQEGTNPIINNAIAIANKAKTKTNIRKAKLTPREYQEAPAEHEPQLKEGTNPTNNKAEAELNNSEAKLTPREYQEALKEHEQQLKEGGLRAITEEDTFEGDSTLASGTVRSSRTKSTISAIREDDDSVSQILSGNVSSSVAPENEKDKDGVEDGSNVSSEESEHTSFEEEEEEDGMASFDESLNSRSVGSAKSASVASLIQPDAPMSPGCSWFRSWFGGAPKQVQKEEDKMTAGLQSIEQGDSAAVPSDSMMSISSRGSCESETRILHVTTSESYDEEDLLDQIEYGLCGSRPPFA